MNLCKTDVERGIAGVMAAVLATRGASLGLIVGIVLYFVLTDRKALKESI